MDHQTGNDYFLTVQYYEHGKPAIHNFVDLKQIPLRGTRRRPDRCGAPGRHARSSARDHVLGNVASLDFVQSPTEIDHYQIQRVADVYVTPSGEDLGKVATRISNLLDEQKYPEQRPH